MRFSLSPAQWLTYQKFLDIYPPTVILDMARTLRVLNAVRHPSVGLDSVAFPLSSLIPQDCLSPILNSKVWGQVFSLTVLSYEFLLQVLLSSQGRREHLLAFEISSYLGLLPDKVVTSWASDKVLFSFIELNLTFHPGSHRAT